MNVKVAGEANAIGFGSLVSYDLGDPHGIGEGYVVGVTRACADVVLVAADTTTAHDIGMPINQCWCKVISSGHDEIAQRLRARYEDMYPNKLVPL